MVPDPFDRRSHIGQVGSLIFGVVGIACHPELLPYQDTQFVAQLEEVVGFCNTASPETDQVNTALGCVTEFCIHTVVICT